MVKNLLSEFGFKKIEEDEAGNSKWELSELSRYINKCGVITIIK